MIKILGTLVALTMLAFAQPALAQPAAPDLAAVSIAPPAPGTDARLASFSGKWKGQWNNGPMTNLAVTRIDGPQQVGVIYAVGDYAAWGIKQPVSLNKVATFDGDSLKVTLGDGSTVTYTQSGNGLSSVFLNKNGGGKQTGTLVRSQ